MQLKRVRGSSVREALAAIRAELGPEALALSTQWVPAPGLRGLVGQRDVEIMAAMDAILSTDRQGEDRCGDASLAKPVTMSFIGTGQRVADDRVATTPEVLAAAVLGEDEGAAV